MVRRLLACVLQGQSAGAGLCSGGMCAYTIQHISSAKRAFADWIRSNESCLDATAHASLEVSLFLIRSLLCMGVH